MKPVLDRWRPARVGGMALTSAPDSIMKRFPELRSWVKTMRLRGDSPVDDATISAWFPVSRKGAGGGRRAASLSMSPERLLAPAWTGRVVTVTGTCGRSRPGFLATAASDIMTALIVDSKLQFFYLHVYISSSTYNVTSIIWHVKGFSESAHQYCVLPLCPNQKGFNDLKMNGGYKNSYLFINHAYWRWSKFLANRGAMSFWKLTIPTRMSRWQLHL